MANSVSWRRLLPLAALLLGFVRLAGPAGAAPLPLLAVSALQPSPPECDQFARIYRYAQESKALCEEGRQVKPGPMTSTVLGQCRAEQGARFDQADVTDLMDKLTQQIQSQGMGNACNVASREAWALIIQ